MPNLSLVKAKLAKPSVFDCAMGQEVKRFYEFGPFRIDTVQRLLMRAKKSCL